MPTTFASARTALAPYVDNGVNSTDTTRIDSRINEAQRRLIDQYNFIARREELERPALIYTASPTNLILDNLDATKVLILCLWREENNELEMASNLEQKAMGMIERDIISAVERERRITTGEVGRLHNELPTGLKMPTSRMTVLLTQSETEATAQREFIQRREEFQGTAPAISFEAKKKLVESYLATAEGGAEVATALKKEALDLLERDIVAAIEKSRRDVTGEVGRLHNELPTGLKVPTSRMTVLLTQSETEATAQREFIQRREEFQGAAPAISFEAKKKLVESYLATAEGGAEVATALKKEALDILERDIVAAIEKSRRDVTGEVGRLHNELPEGLKFPTTRLTTLLGQAATEATAHLEFLQRREELEGVTLPFSFEVKKKLVESYLATSQAAVEPAMALKKDALDLLERDTIAAVEKLRKATTGEVGRLHNELATGLKVPTSRMTKLLNQAVSDAIAHQKFLQKPDDDDFAAPPVTFEIKRTLVESYLASLEGGTEVALGLKKTALDLIQRDVEAHDQTLRRTTRYDLSLTSPNSFGYHWGRVGLGFENSLTFSNNAIKRAVTSAEESLMNSGKWVGTIAEYTLTLSNSGEVFLPREIETVLFVSFDGDPRPVHDRFAEYMTGGTGIRTTENPGRSGFSDLGDMVDSTDGKTKRKYWVTVPQENKETVILYLAKRRFVPHTSDSEPMFLNNYEAVAQAAMSILTNGQQGNYEAAKQLLAAQVYQQYFKPQLYGVHNKPVLALR